MTTIDDLETHHAGLDLTAASVGPHPISGDLTAAITWSNGDKTIGLARHDHMIGLLHRARREGIEVRRDGDAGPRIVNLGDAFPYPRLTVAYAIGDRTWFEISRARHWDALEVVPPRYFRGGFFMGEEYAHVADRAAHRLVPVYTAHVERAGRYFCRIVRADRIFEAQGDLVGAL